MTDTKFATKSAILAMAAFALVTTQAHAGLTLFLPLFDIPGRNKLKAGSRLLVSPFPEIKFILSCCGVL